MSIEVTTQSRRARYLLLERLGSGGAGEAWRARRVGAPVDQEVCLKRPVLPLGPSQRRALLEEARVLSRLRHANVVALLGVEEEKRGEVFLVLELVCGANLKTLSRRHWEHGKSLAPPVAASVGLCLCRALAAAQRALPPGVVHRDVTPHNVLVSTEGEVKLADFGIARALDRETWTACGRVKGKVDFLSPEQLSGDQLDVRSDLFAVGVLLYELLCGVRPFRRASDTLTLEAIRLGQYLPLSAQARHLPSRLVMTVERFLQRDPSLRPRTADAAADLLAHSADEHQASVELRRLASGFWADRQPCAAPNRYQDGVTEGTGTRRQGRGALSSLEVTAR